MDIVGIICGSLFSIIGLGILTLLLSRQSFIIRSKKWSTVSGTIQSSRIVEETVKDDNGNPTIYYQPLIVYRYEINGKEYVVRDPVYDVIHYNNSQENAEQLMTEYSIGKTVNVFYNPKSPEESTLKTRYNNWHLLFYLIPIILLAIGAIYFWFVFNET